MIAATGSAVPLAQVASLLQDPAGIRLGTKLVERATDSVSTVASATLDADTLEVPRLRSPSYFL